MMVMKSYLSAMRENIIRWADDIGKADILIGIPCYNNESTIEHVFTTVAEGLHKHFPDKTKAILVSDGGSLDDTREVIESSSIPDDVHKNVGIYRGIPGKGTSIRAIFQTAEKLEVKGCAIFDSDLRNISDHWVKDMIEPILSGEADYLTPFYSRHKYDGTITNNIVYPMVRAIFGQNVRQPIGGDFGFSGEMAKYFANKHVWDTDVAKFGIDVWMTVTAMGEGFKLAQVNLGRKIHDAKDPASDLGPMFFQVVSTLFYLIGYFEKTWRDREEKIDIPVIRDNAELPDIQPIKTNIKKAISEFVDGFKHFDSFYRQILDHTNYSALKDIADETIANNRNHLNFKFSSELWAKILYDFAFIFQTWNRNRRRLVDIMTPLYFGRTAAYCLEVKDMTDEEAEKIVQAQAEKFEELKDYLGNKFTLWDE